MHKVVVLSKGELHNNFRKKKKRDSIHTKTFKKFKEKNKLKTER